MPEYTFAASIAAVLAATAAAFVRPRLLYRKSYWITLSIVFAFQLPVDGWLTKASTPIVIYDEAQVSGIRIGWNSPIEDFLFGYALITGVLVVWEHRRLRRVR